MIKIILFFLLAFPVSVCFATPPTSIALAYNLEKGSLHVEAVHPSFNLVKSYVRLMNVYVNSDLVTTMNYFRQNNNEGFSDDVPLTAKFGDVIKVELFCTLGGSMAREMKVSTPVSTTSPDDDNTKVSADLDNNAADN